MTPAKLVASLPDTIRVGPFDMLILKMDEHRAAAEMKWGFFSSIEQVIAIQGPMPTRQKAADTFIHEVNHAIWWAYGLEDEDKEERTVGTLATGWVQVYRDNAWLLGWLKKALA